jgi:hypothetical protein
MNVKTKKLKTISETNFRAFVRGNSLDSSDPTIQYNAKIKNKRSTI